MRRLLGPGDTVVDVGAYKGGYTYWMRREVGPSGSVYAFEPQPSLAGYLRRRARDFGWRNVHVEALALSSQRGTRELMLPGAEPSPAASLVGASLRRGATGYRVATGTLDEALAGMESGASVRFIKCDVEGHELDVLRGAADTLGAFTPTLLVECERRHLRGHDVGDVFGHLESLGYRGFFFWRGARVDVADFDPDRHQVQGRRPYANNFGFVHRSRGDAP